MGVLYPLLPLFEDGKNTPYTTYTYSERVLSGTNGDGVKMFKCGQAIPTFEHLRTQTPSKMGTPALPRYNPKQKGHCPPQYTPFDSPKHHNILCFFFPQISLAVSPFPDLTAKYSQYRFHAVFPRFFPPFELPVSAPPLRGFYSRNLPTHNDSPIDFLTAIY